MRKSIIVGLTFCAALALAGQQAVANDKDPRAHRGHHDGRKASHIAETTTPQPAAPFRIPAHPVVRDCVHVTFPQCSRGYDSLNDGQFNVPYR